MNVQFMHTASRFPSKNDTFFNFQFFLFVLDGDFDIIHTTFGKMTEVKNSNLAEEHEVSLTSKRKINTTESHNAINPRFAKRNNSHAEAVKLEIELTIPTTIRRSVSKEWITYVSTWALVRHVSYSRGIIPTPVDQIMNANKEDLIDPEKKKKLSPTERKIVNASINMTSLLDDLKLLFDPQLGLSISTVLLLIGPSWSRPKEFYRISFPCLGENTNAPGEENSNTTMANEHGLSRRLIRSFLEASQNPENEKASDFLLNPPSSAASYQCHVMVEMASDAANRLFQESRDDHLVGTETDKASDETTKWHQLSQKVIVRQNFSPEPKTNSRQTIPMVEVSINQQDVGDVRANVTNESPSDDNKFVWLSLKSFVKGFRP